MPAAAAPGLSENFRPADPNEGRFGTARRRPVYGAGGRFEPGGLCKSDGFGDRAQRNAPTPALVADKIPRPALGDIVQHLPDHDTGALESGLAMADFGVGHDIFAQFNALTGAFAIFHACQLPYRN